MTEKVKEIIFKTNTNEDGNLIAIEQNKDIPFEIKRIFYIFGTKGDKIRGEHANARSEFVLISVAGSCKVRTHDGKNEHFFDLDSPEKGLYLNKLVWKDMYQFSPDCVLLVVTNELYDPSEYILNYEKFLKDNS